MATNLICITMCRKQTTNTATMKSFLAFKVISTWIFVYFQKGFTMKLWQNTQFTTAILFCFIFTAYGGEYNNIVRDS